MSEPDEFIVKDRNKRCRGCGKHNTSLCRTANNYDFPQIKYLKKIFYHNIKFNNLKFILLSHEIRDMFSP